MPVDKSIAAKNVAAGDLSPGMVDVAPKRKKNASSDGAALARKEAGLWLKETRLGAGLTQLQMAQVLGLAHYTFLSQVETGVCRLPAELWSEYARITAIDPKRFCLTLLKYYEPAIFACGLGQDWAKMQADMA